jgi:PAS domain S-box-containing protein
VTTAPSDSNAGEADTTGYVPTRGTGDGNGYSAGTWRLTDAGARYLLDHLTDVVSVVDESGTILYQSPGSESVKGWPAAELVGTDVLSYIHPEDREMVATAIAENAGTVGRFPLPTAYRFRRPDGTYCWLESTATNPGTDGPVDGYIVSSRDVTDRVEAELEAARQTERLEQFASILSHDLRNPLAAVRGRLDLARETGDRSHLDDAERALDRADELVDRTLSLARNGQHIGETEPFSVSAVAEEAWEVVAPARATLVTSDMTLDADPERLRTVFENLFRNATEHAGPAVTVEVGPLADGAGFYVADDGPGIPPDYREHAFEVGYTTTVGGTGFGLAIVLAIVEAHGWTVSVTDEPGGGARFEILV